MPRRKQEKAAKKAVRKTGKIENEKSADEPVAPDAIGAPAVDSLPSLPGGKTEIKEEAKPLEEAKEETKSAEESHSGTPLVTKILLFGILAVVVIFLVARLNVVEEVKGLEQKCLEIQNDPLLKYPCKCLPTKTPDDENDTVYEKSNPMCTCECSLGNGTTWTVEVRASK